MESNGFETRRTTVSERQGVNWGGAWTGFVIAAAFLFLWTSLWAAIGYGSDVGFFTGDALGWWVAGTVLVSVYLGAFVAAWVGRTERAIPAMVTGLVVWALFTFGTVIFGDTMARAAGVVIGGAAAAGRIGSFGSLQNAVGGGVYLIFGTTILSAFAAAAGGMQAAKMLLVRTASQHRTEASARPVDVRDRVASQAEMSGRRS